MTGFARKNSDTGLIESRGIFHPNPEEDRIASGKHMRQAVRCLSAVRIESGQGEFRGAREHALVSKPGLGSSGQATYAFAWYVFDNETLVQRDGAALDPFRQCLSRNELENEVSSTYVSLPSKPDEGASARTADRARNDLVYAR